MTENSPFPNHFTKPRREHPRPAGGNVRDRNGKPTGFKPQDGTVAGAGTGETVEQQVQKLFAGRSMMEIEAGGLLNGRWHRKQTQQAIEQGVEVIVQAVLHWEDLHMHH